MIGILRYNAGNWGSVARAIRRLGISAATVETADEMATVDGLVFPGAGAARSAMDDLRSRGLIDPLRAFRKPFLGLCLGMQLLMEFSEEGQTECLGIVRGQVRRMPDGVMSPHIGWNRLSTGRYAYFVHRYVCVPEDRRVVTMTVEHGATLCAAIRQANYFGVQWHPEKSGSTGDQFLQSFAALCGHSATSPALPTAPSSACGRTESFA
ncbi:MAG: imidazole glycerol phosphate synthase subunit HisH [Thermoguttaceae bacterium]